VSRPFRFTFILILAAVGTVLAAAGGWRYARASAPLSGPIILVSIDTLRADHLPAYGYRKVRTPAIDALAADGVVFERAYSHAPQTLPAHASLLSGRLPFETGVRDDVGFAIRPGERLLQQMLRDRGYTTAGIVSSFLLRKETGIGQGFDYFDAELPQAAADANVPPVERDGATSEAIAEHWLESNRSSREFLFLHLYEPHAPYNPPARFSAFAPYDGEIAYADEIVGRLVKYLKSHQLYDRSTIVVLSDHGEGLGDHGEQEHGLFLYDEAIHVPLIMKLEGNTAAGRRIADVVSHIDVVPTILDLVKAPAPGSLRGRSLKPIFDGGRIAPRPVYSEALFGRYHFGWSELTALTDDRYRYIRAPHDELYDLFRDRRETVNLASDRRDPRESLRRALADLAGASPVPAPAPPSPDARPRLRALGYVAAAPATAPAGALADPKDKRDVVETYRRAVDLAARRRWPEAIALLQDILRNDPDLPGVWSQLATFAARIDRHDVAADAYRHLGTLAPADPAGPLGAAASLLKLRRFDEARDEADQAIEAAGERDARSEAAGHELLARIALARHDAAAARDEADRAHDVDPKMPLPPFVEGRLLYDQGRFADALEHFEQALVDARQPGATPIADLHYDAADTYMRLDRYPEAEAQYIAELHDFPDNVRARAGLAALYHATDRDDAAARSLESLTRTSPTPDAYAAAARLWTAIGDRQRADAVRAEAREMFPSARRSR